MVVSVSTDSNNSARKLFSALGGRITFEGAGCGLGQEVGVARREVVPQAEIAVTQASHNSISDGRGSSAMFFMLHSDGGQFFGLGMFGGAGLIDLLDHRDAGAGLLPGLAPVGAIAAPFPASTKHAARPGHECQYSDQSPVHATTVLRSKTRSP